MALPAQDAPPKMSRYRSARQKNSELQQTHVTAGPPTSFNNSSTTDTIQRSRSRYRRAQSNTQAARGAPLPNGAAQVAQVNNARGVPTSATHNNARREVGHGGETHHPSAPTPPRENVRPWHASDGKASRFDQSQDPEDRARLEARRLLEAERDRQHKLREQADYQKDRENTQRQQQEHVQKPQDDSIQVDQGAIRYNLGESHLWKDPTARSRPDPSLRPSGSRELLAFFKRKRGDHLNNFVKPSKDVYGSDQHAQYQAGAAAPVQPLHGTDAPISAVNAGERQVLVEANGVSIYLSVTPSTTPVDLIRSASARMNKSIDFRTSVLMENFGKVGVQRPLRRYEHIRDILNSWDHDRQNSLVIVPSATGGRDPELDAKYAPSAQPDEFGCQLSYSQKPGKWDKRWITLRQDGQVTVAKKQGLKPSDQTNVCHLSDFDIYTPAPKQLSRKIRPPKKHCFAVKSQQKSNIFASMENFVHFFCSSDKRAAAEFYRAVQGWRSWYLVNVMGQDSSNKPEQATAGAANAEALAKTGGAAHGRVASNESQYQIGGFKPLISLDRMDAANRTNGEIGQGVERSRTRSRSNSASHGQGFGFNTSRTRTSGGGRGAGPPSAFPPRLGNGATDHGRQQSGCNSTSPADDSAFVPSGLLGRTYSKRQAEAALRENERTNGADGDGHALSKSNSHGLEPPPRASLDQYNSHSDPNLKRSSSQRKANKPLVDLTPQFREPPQHAKKGKGFYPDAVGPGGLVENATSPEEAVQLPASTDWRARQYQRTGTMRGTQRPNTAATTSGPGADIDRTMSLARNKSVRNKGVGGGGTRVEDVWEKNAQGMGFQAGSLLDKVQKEGREHFSDGPAGMKWDRSKGEETVVPYGEAT